MKLDSPLFDRIRVKPARDRQARGAVHVCEWPGCQEAGTHRAPKGRTREREYWRFCLDHVREYNQSYNFFEGMSAEAVERFQKDALTGHRPTWKLGLSMGSRFKRLKLNGLFADSTDPFAFQGEFGDGPTRRQNAHAYAEQRTVRNAERKALHTMGLEEGATRAEIKGRFKELVKRHHPDANGGDRGTEDKLREIIEAYRFLKSTGLC
ncbi:MAG: DnaJ domain-containing protein [Bradyrhizobiaceae bacterium]|nr:DnaJ domain-containing protein [Bradyrhizobiaceae bacterium]